MPKESLLSKGESMYRQQKINRTGVLFVHGSPIGGRIGSNSPTRTVDGSTQSMSKRTRERSREAAAYLKKMGVTRKTGMCPMGCGREYSTEGNGERLIIHLAQCRGRRKGAKRYPGR